MKNSSEIAVALSLGLATLVACNGGRTADGHADQDPARCARCHTPEFDSTQRPPHLGARPTTCGVCHTQTSWHHVRVDHPFWELTGAHGRAATDQNLAGSENRVKCFWCHRGDPPMFRFTSHACIACHADDRKGVKFPGHDGFSTSCESCHSTEAWKPAQHPEAGKPAAKPAAPATVETAPKPPKIAPPKIAPRHSTPATPVRPTTTEVVPSPPERPTTPVTSPLPDITSHASRRR